MDEKAYIVILNYNGWRDTIPCLESVYANDYKNFQVIVCDNASTDDSLRNIRAWAEGKLESPRQEGVGTYAFQPIKKPISVVEYGEEEIERPPLPEESTAALILLKARSNRGFSAGNNMGLRFACRRKDFSYVWLLNNDTVVDAAALSRMVSKQKETGCGAVGSVLRYYREPDRVQCVGGRLELEKFDTSGIEENVSITNLRRDLPIQLLPGASFLATAELLEDIGNLEEAYFLYCEELEFAARAEERGWRFTYAEDSFTYHKGGASTGKSGSAYRDYHSARSWTIFICRHHREELPGLRRKYRAMMRKQLKHLHLRRAWAIYSGMRDGERDGAGKSSST